MAFKLYCGVESIIEEADADAGTEEYAAVTATGGVNGLWSIAPLLPPWMPLPTPLPTPPAGLLGVMMRLPRAGIDVGGEA